MEKKDFEVFYQYRTQCTVLIKCILTIRIIIYLKLVSVIYGSVFTKSGGKLALSGLVKRQAEVVMSAYRDSFDDLKVEAAEEDWVLVTGIKR